MNFLLRTMAWQTLLGKKRSDQPDPGPFFHLPSILIINTPGAIILGMVYNFLPFMVLLCIMYYPKLTGILSWQPEIWEPLLSIPSGRSFFP